MKYAHDGPGVMMWPLLPLALGALFAGTAFKHSFIGERKELFWNGSIANIAVVERIAEDPDTVEFVDGGAYASADDHSEDETHGAKDGEKGKDGGHGYYKFPTWVLWSPLVMMVLGFLAAYHWYFVDVPRPGMLRPGGKLYAFLKNKWYFDELYDFLFVKPALAIGRVLWKTGDGRIIDGLGPNGVAAATVVTAKRVIARLQTGYLYHYAFAMLIGVVVFATLALVRGGSL